MLMHPTLDALNTLGLHGLAKGFKEMAGHAGAATLEHAEWLGLLLEFETTLHRDKRFAARARATKLRQSATIEDIDFKTPQGLDRALISKLATGGWVKAHQNLIITGPCGVGKSWLACALGNKACRDDQSVLYRRASRLFQELALARGDGRYPRLLKEIAKVHLLIIDDWGPEPLSPGNARDLLEIVEDRHGRGAILITSQVPVDRWHDIIANPTLADAILDRIVHNAHRIALSGDSLRKTRVSELQQA